MRGGRAGGGRGTQGGREAREAEEDAGGEWEGEEWKVGLVRGLKMP